MRIKARIKEIENNPEYLGIAACMIPLVLLLLYKLGTWVGVMYYEQLAR